ncbi:MAG TPA: hypothetical protein VGZ00_11050 [Candidatus Baltobacteraceae bacterium]|jgi:hypothetical protein|nr:hypothetical protein [Candidatus Baltobacteraceae bacterium]
MSGRVLSDASSAAVSGAVSLPVALAMGAIVPSGIDLDGEPQDRLPSDHPAWMRDAISISRRAREMLARITPVAIRILTFWDHRVRSVLVAGRRLSVDPSGSYRMD